MYPIKKKSDVFPMFKKYKARMELESSKMIKCLRINNGGKYTDGEFLDFCKQEGIQRQFTVAYTPQQNGVVERMNKTLTEIIRAMLRTAAQFILGRSSQNCLLYSKSVAIYSYWVENGDGDVDYSYLHAFGCPVYMMYNIQERIKLDPKSKKYIFLGYADGVKRYRLWDLTTHKIVINIDVIFVEDQLQMRDEDDNM